MTKRNKVFSVPVRLSVRAFNDSDAIKQVQDAITDGLLEPGFVEDGAVEEGQIFELENMEGE